MTTSLDSFISSVKSQVVGISTQETEKRLANGHSALLLDVREREDYAQGYIPGAENIPRGYLELRIEGRANARDTAIIVYGEGHQGELAARDLQNMGYTDVVYLEGGTKAWSDAGLSFDRARQLRNKPRFPFLS